MRFVWIGGWGIDPGDIKALAQRRWPAGEHVVAAPGPAQLAEAWEAIGPGDRVVGYSLGAFLLMRAAGLPVPPEQLALVAPIVDLRSERGLGGRIEEVRLRYMIRRLARDPLRTVAEFYATAGLSLAPPRELPYPQEDLRWGLEQLLSPPGQVDADRLRGATAIVGDRDPLVDSGRLAELWPGLTVVAGAGHDLGPLLEATP